MGPASQIDIGWIEGQHVSYNNKPLISLKGAWEDGEADYSQQAMECFKNWVHNEIDQSLLQQASIAVFETGVSSGKLQFALNGSTLLPPKNVMELAKTYYERIMTNRGKFCSVPTANKLTYQ